MKRVLGVIFSAALAIGGVALTAAPSQAASGTGLDGTDPVRTGCVNGSISIAYQDIYMNSIGPWVGAVDLRYSPACGTNWVRVYSNGSASSGQSKKYIERPAQGGLPYFRQAEIDSGAAGWTYGMQVYAPGSTTICYQGGLVTSAWTAWSTYRCLS